MVRTPEKVSAEGFPTPAQWGRRALRGVLVVALCCLILGRITADCRSGAVKCQDVALRHSADVWRSGQIKVNRAAMNSFVRGAAFIRLLPPATTAFVRHHRLILGRVGFGFIGFVASKSLKRLLRLNTCKLILRSSRQASQASYCSHHVLQCYRLGLLSRHSLGRGCLFSQHHSKGRLIYATQR